MRESSTRRERLEVAHRNSLRLLKLVNNLLDFSRLEAGRIEAVFEPDDLPVHTMEVASLFRSAVEKAGLKLEVDCPPLSEPVYVDRDMWEKILFNLLSNAFKFTLKGEIRIQLREYPGSSVGVNGNGHQPMPPLELAGRPSLCLSVSDTGVGIPATELPKIFERFYRVRHAQARSHEGTGIGLALVQELARLHGGSVVVASTEGKGTTFHVWIPLGKEHLPKERIGAGRRQISTGGDAMSFVQEALRWLPDDTTTLELEENTVAKNPGARIVLADDNADMRGYIHGLLAKQGYEVIAVDNGEAALEAIRASKPSLILSDVMMPRLDGFALLQTLRNDPEMRAIPIILISARAGEEARLEGVEAGADDYLIKPFSARELLARVNTHLKLGRARRETEETLRRLAAEAQSANRSKDRFLAALSHELRTPLTPVLMTVSTLFEDDRLPTDVREQLGMMERNITLEARLIDDLLDLTAVSSGKLSLHPQPCNAHELMRLALEMVEDAAQTKGVEVVCHFQAAHHGLMADPARFQQVVWNLLRNAVKFTPAGGQVTIHTSNKTAPDGQEWLWLEVVDTGIGIEADGLEKVFQPFEQGRVTGDHRFGGLGLGLAIARAIVDMHGGKIRAHSDGENKGATFVVELPTSKVAKTNSMPFRKHGDTELLARTEPRMTVRRILLVEDHAPTLQVLSSLLGRSGYEVIAVSSIAAAMAAVTTGTFDLVISDLGLPDGTGIQLMSGLRDRFGLRGIALTGYGMEEDMVMAREAGFIAHLVKPVHIAELRKILSSLS